MNRKIFGICIVIFFVIGILGSVYQIDTLSKHMDMESQEAPYAREVVKSASLLQKIDDFQIISDTGGMNHTVLEGLRQIAQLFLAVAVILFLGIMPSVRRLYFSGKRVPVFLVVSFIHRADGKKKACFDEQK